MCILIKKTKTMKKLKLLLVVLLLLITTKTFSQNTYFTLFILGATDCQYSITGNWIDTVGQPQQGSLSFAAGDTSSTFQDIWYCQVESTNTTSILSICVVPNTLCNCPTVCIQQLPITQGSITILLCDSIVGVEEQQILSLMDNKYYDLFGREIKDISKYPINSFYIKNGRKYIKE